MSDGDKNSPSERISVSTCTEVPAVIVSFGDVPDNKVGNGVTNLVTSLGGNPDGHAQMGSLMYHYCSGTSTRIWKQTISSF